MLIALTGASGFIGSHIAEALHCRGHQKVEWKAFDRVNLTDIEMMQVMADCGCLELRLTGTDHTHIRNPW